MLSCLVSSVGCHIQSMNHRSFRSNHIFKCGCQSRNIAECTWVHKKLNLVRLWISRKQEKNLSL